MNLLKYAYDYFIYVSGEEFYSGENLSRGNFYGGKRI